MDATVLKRRLSQAQLPPLPLAVTRLMSDAYKPNVSAPEIAQIVEAEPALTARILQFANSSVHGFPQRIGSLPHAVVVLGAPAIANLALEAAVYDMLKSAHLEALWRHSLAVGLAARLLARHARRRNVQEVFTAGLLHDAGKMVLRTALPDVATQLDTITRAGDMYVAEAEHAVLGVTHADIALWLATKWQLPTVVRDPMAFHHHPDQAAAAPVETAIVHVADVLVKAAGYGHSGDELVPPLSPRAWQMLNLDGRALTPMLATLHQEFEAVMRDFI